jgi:peptidyl-prolyl cis-trans isomerase SurA
MKHISIFFLALLTCYSSASAQKVVADKIIAKVGDRIVLKSDIDNAISDYKRQGEEVELPADANCFFLQGQLVQKLLVLQAIKDSLPFSEDELDALLDNQIRGFINMYGSQEMLEQIAGKTVYEIKEDFREPFRERKLAEQMRNKILENIKMTPTEVKAYYSSIPADSLPFYESELEVGQLILYPRANSDIEDFVVAQLNDLKAQVEGGRKKFADLAKVYSEDPGSRDNGGQYSINRTDKNWDPAFMQAAFRLKEGQISPVFRSKFGFHIIQMVSRSGDDAVVRHILKIPSVTATEINEAKATLDTARSKIIAGALSFGQAVDKYSNDDNSKFTGGMLMGRDGSIMLTIDQMDKNAVVMLKNMKPGDLSMPYHYTDERGKTVVAVLYLKARTEPHRENLKDDYNRIADRALEYKKDAALEKWFHEHIPQFYITIDKDFRTCPSIQEWWDASADNAAN